MIVLHGWGHHKNVWDDFVARMEHVMPTIALDLPGFGDEPLVDGTWQIPDYAQWVATEIAKRGLTDVVLLGHSFGGRVAAYLASQRPSWLHGLVLYGAPCLYRPTIRVRWQNRTARLLGRLPIPQKVRSLVRNEEDRAAHASGMGPVFRNAVRFDQTTTLPRIDVPTLMVWGEHDAEAPLFLAREIAELIPHATLEVIKGAGHSAHLDEPTLFFGLVRKYVDHKGA